METSVVLLKPFLTLLWLGGFGALYWHSRAKTLVNTQLLEIYNFRLAPIAPIGFWLLRTIPYRFEAGYDRKIRLQLAELYGQREAVLFFAVHNAQRVVLAVAAIFFGGLVALMGEVDRSFYLLGLLLPALVVYWVDAQLTEKIKARKQAILIDLPEFLNQLVLLISAGLHFSVAVQKVVLPKEASRPLYRELHYILAEQRAGKPVSQAYEEFAQRCRVPEITRLVASIVQNLNRGSADLVEVLNQLAREAWSKRKELARQQGEEAGSKLVFPMVMVFVAVAIIVLAPAVITMSR